MAEGLIQRRKWVSAHEQIVLLDPFQIHHVMGFRSSLPETLVIQE
jgi:hypothetical protein